MTKKSKTKKIKKSAPSVKKVSRKNNYEAHWLAIILIAFLLLEGFTLTSTTPADWQRGASVLDVSADVAVLMEDMSTTFEPIVSAIRGVDQFYKLSAVEMMKILDLSDSDPLADVVLVIDGVHEFYDESSNQLAGLLDYSAGFGSVAGASTY
jgi:hypothetical protein